MFPNCANSANTPNGENEQRVTYLVTRQAHDAGGRGCDLAPGLIAVFLGAFGSDPAPEDSDDGFCNHHARKRNEHRHKQGQRPSIPQ